MRAQTDINESQGEFTLCCIWFAAAETPASLRIIDDSEVFLYFRDVVVRGLVVRFFRIIGQSPDRLSLRFLSVVMIRAPLLLQ